MRLLLTNDDGIHAEGLEALLSAMRGFPDPAEDAPRVQAPTLLITSDQDLLVSRESAERLARAIPDCRHELVEGCGHTVPIEAPDAWRELVLGFIAE